MIISRQTQLHKLHTSMYLCVFVCVYSSVPTVFAHTAALMNMLHPLCDCAHAGAHVDYRVRKWDFSCCLLITSFFFLIFIYPAPLPHPRLAPVVLTIPTPCSSPCFVSSSSFCPASSVSLLFVNCNTLLFYLFTAFLLVRLRHISLWQAITQPLRPHRDQAAPTTGQKPL